MELVLLTGWTLDYIKTFDDIELADLIATTNGILKARKFMRQQ